MIRLRFAACVLLGLFIAPASASAQLSVSTTVSPNVATYPDTKELTYRVEITTDDAIRLTWIASNGAGLLPIQDGASLEGPGTLTAAPQRWVVPGPPPPGSCYVQTTDDIQWSQELVLDLPSDSISTLVLPMRAGTLRQGSPSEYWFTLTGAGTMARVPVSGPAVAVSYCVPLHGDPSDPNPPFQSQLVPQSVPVALNLSPSPVVRNRVNVLRGYARVHLRCDLDCKGTVRIKRHGTLLGQRGFHAAAGKTSVLWVPIKRQGRRMLARHKLLAADVAVQMPTMIHRARITLRGLDQ